MQTQATVRLPSLEAAFDVTWEDVEYRHDGQQGWLARIYQPRGNGPFPALIEVHGGAWNTNDRTQNAPLATALAESGVVVASVDFRLGTQAPYPASIADINYATRWLKGNARNFNADGSALGGLGLSSGGHMIVLSAMRPRDPRYMALALSEEVDASLAYVMSGWGVLAPHARYLHARSQDKTELLASHERYFGDEATMQEADTQLILERGEKVELPPVLLFQGADDDVLSPRTAEHFVESYGKAGGIIELAMFPKAGHGYSREGGSNALRTVDALRSFMARQLHAIARGY
ncbi:MAG: alpha/beta hydrolase [Chloroflexi bacterium]|nr:alpha/beta hydrolase [Chloroflexota bacterium]